MRNKLSQEDLIRLVRIIMNAGEDEETGKEYTEDEIDRMIEIFEDNIISAHGSDLIFYPESCGLSEDATAEDIVMAALRLSDERNK